MHSPTSLIYITLLLALACCKQDLKKGKNETPAIKKDELVLTLSTEEKLDSKSKIMSTLDSDYIEENDVEFLVKSYPKDSQYRTIVRLNVEEDKFTQFKKQLESNDSVKKVLGNRIYQIHPFDKFNSEKVALEETLVEFDEPFHKIIGTKEALNFARGEGVIVAVTDMGTDDDHEDLAQNIWKNLEEFGQDKQGKDKCSNGIDDDSNGKIDDCLGWNFTENNNNVSPSASLRAQHGTHVAGIIGSVENGKGTVGVAPGSELMIINFYGFNVEWTSTMLLESYVYAIENGAKVINTSYKIDSLVNDEIYLSALEYAEDNNVIVVNSAGNNGELDPKRLTLSNILFVANTGTGYTKTCPVDKKQSTSNYGYGIDISAPGCKINSTISNNKYNRQSGTSMATPIVSGALALIWSQNPDWTKEMVVSRLLSTTDDISNVNDPEVSRKLGTGRVNLVKALNGEDQRPVKVDGLTRQLRTVDKYFSLKFNGLPDWGTLKSDTVQLYRLDEDIDINRTDFENLIENSAQLVPTNIRQREKLSYGSGTLDVEYRKGQIESGKYLIKVNSHLRDPFSNYLDGNADGVAFDGDHYYHVSILENKDYLDPVLNSIVVSGNKKVTPSAPWINISLDVEDDFSKIKEVEIDIRNTNYRSIYHKAVCNEECRNLAGKLQYRIPASKLGISGNYYIRSIKITDDSEYERETIYSADFHTVELYKTKDQSLKAIHVKDSKFTLEGFKAKDTEEPKMTGTPQMRSTARVSQVVLATIFATDVGSGIKTISATLKPLQGGKEIRSRKDLFVARKGDTQTVRFDISSSAKAGEYMLTSLLLIDNEGNSNYLYCKKKGAYVYSGTNIPCSTISILEVEDPDSL